MRCKLICLVCIIILGISGCGAPKVPIPVTEYGEMNAIEHQNLLILLRGRGGSHKDFEKHGVINQVTKRGLPFDIVVPHASFLYYRTETLGERLKKDIIDPARAKGYKKIWLAGFSMGGLGSLFYLAEYPDEKIDGVILCSPFLGWDRILDDIKSKGGVKHWELPEKHNNNWQYRLWGWVKRYSHAPEDYPPIYLGYGSTDFLSADGPKLLAEVLNPENVFVVKGGHNYPTFRKIWEQHMERLEGTLKKPN